MSDEDAGKEESDNLLFNQSKEPSEQEIPIGEQNNFRKSVLMSSASEGARSDFEVEAASAN